VPVHTSFVTRPMYPRSHASRQHRHTTEAFNGTWRGVCHTPGE